MLELSGRLLYLIECRWWVDICGWTYIGSNRTQTKSASSFLSSKVKAKVSVINNTSIPSQMKLILFGTLEFHSNHCEAVPSYVYRDLRVRLDSPSLSPLSPSHTHIIPPRTLTHLTRIQSRPLLPLSPSSSPEIFQEPSLPCPTSFTAGIQPQRGGADVSHGALHRHISVAVSPPLPKE